MRDIRIEPSWKERLRGEFEAEYFARIRAHYYEAVRKSVVLPPPKLIFSAFDATPFEKVKVVILGQDPYHGIERGIPQAMGLSFSVPKGVGIPSSLHNIFKELKRDLGLEMPQSGDLSHWAKQGVLLLNAILSVEFKKPLSHQRFGWEIFTDKIIEILSQNRENLVFMLWGRYARSKRGLIDGTRHFILEAPHPSPLARGFVGCGHFSKCNELLRKCGKSAIDWRVE